MEPGVPKALFDTGMKFDAALPYTVNGDGQRFLVITQAAEGNPRPITAVVNWASALKR